MNLEEQQSAEQGVRDALDYIINDEHGRDGEAVDWQLRVHHPRCLCAPHACHPNQTVLLDRSGTQYLVTITMLKAFA